MNFPTPKRNAKPMTAAQKVPSSGYLFPKNPTIRGNPQNTTTKVQVRTQTTAVPTRARTCFTGL